MPRKRRLRTISKTKKNERVKRTRARRVLNLPDQIWQAYKNSQEIEKNEEKLHFNVSEPEKKCTSVDEEKKVPILKQLSVKVDNYFVFPNKWVALTKKLNECLEVHKNIYQHLINVKQILVSCSDPASFQTHGENSVTKEADIQLEEVIKNMHNQEDALLNFKQIFYEISLPLEIMNRSFIGERCLMNQERLSNSIETKEIKLENLEKKHNVLQAELQKARDKFCRLKISFKRSIQEKNKLISQLQLKLSNMRKHFMRVQKINRAEKERNADPMENQIQQVRTLIGLSHVMITNMIENQNTTTNVHKKDLIIKDLKKKSQELEDKNKKNDHEIKRLLKAKDAAEKEKLEAEKKYRKIEKEKNLKINHLMSALNELKRKHDRWLIDRFFQKCHSIMLFEKMKQVEMSQIAVRRKQYKTI